ncbi:hypothetical protein Q7P37_004518 [Cladosporium fusiforme]
MHACPQTDRPNVSAFAHHRPPSTSPSLSAASFTTTTYALSTNHPHNHYVRAVLPSASQAHALPSISPRSSLVSPPLRLVSSRPSLLFSRRANLTSPARRSSVITAALRTRKACPVALTFSLCFSPPSEAV